jgi:hypothetical protein
MLGPVMMTATRSPGSGLYAPASRAAKPTEAAGSAVMRGLPERTLRAADGVIVHQHHVLDVGLGDREDQVADAARGEGIHGEAAGRASTGALAAQGAAAAAGAASARCAPRKAPRCFFGRNEDMVTATEAVIRPDGGKAADVVAEMTTRGGA